jgi:ACS family tartrate transporter-like MFS transporter
MDPSSRKALSKKIWWKILPVIFLLCIISIIERSSIGYAALMMNTDLEITPWVFGLICGIFFIGFCLFEIPSTHIMARIGTRIGLARILVIGGIVVILTGFVSTPLELAILRFLFGVAVAGFSSGIILYLSFWFREEEVAKCISAFIIAIPIAMVIGSPLSTWILQNVSWFGLAGWRWLFIVEGIPSVIAGVWVLIFLPGTPAEARWLDAEERTILENERDAGRVTKELPGCIPIRELLHTRMILILAVCLFLIHVALLGIIFWLPQIFQSFELVNSYFGVGLLLMASYASAAIILVITGWHSDHTHDRIFHVAVPMVVSALAILADAVIPDPAVSAVCLGIALVALFSALPSFWAIAISVIPHGFRPAGTAFINAFASIGCFLGPVVFGYFVQRSHEFDAVTGLVLLAAALVIGSILLVAEGRLPVQKEESA